VVKVLVTRVSIVPTVSRVNHLFTKPCRIMFLAGLRYGFFYLKVLKGRCSLVVVGAVISEDMVKDGYETILNVDISQVVIDSMTEKYKDTPQLQCNISTPLLMAATCNASHVCSEVILL
jgi:hypothetical protein